MELKPQYSVVVVAVGFLLLADGIVCPFAPCGGLTFLNKVFKNKILEFI